MVKVGIIALGLIGGSILKSISNKGFDIVVVSRNKKTLEKALKYRAETSSDIKDVKDCDIVFVCTPIDKTLETLDALENIVSKNTIVLDVASTKEFVMKKNRPYKFIGSHPMAGTENSGFDASFKELFEGAKWVLIPDSKVDDEDIENVKKIIKQTGASIIFVNDKEHDEAMALISHLPMLISQAIFKSVQNNSLALKLASSGFRDMTRLALSNVDMADDMLKYNKANIDKAYTNFLDCVEELKNKNYKSQIEELVKKRGKMYSREGKNIIEI